MRENRKGEAVLAHLNKIVFHGYIWTGGHHPRSITTNSSLSGAGTSWSLSGAPEKNSPKQTERLLGRIENVVDLDSEDLGMGCSSTAD